MDSRDRAALARALKAIYAEIGAAADRAVQRFAPGGRVPTRAGGTGTTQGAEPPLGNPAADGDALVSTIAGVRSWVDVATQAELDAHTGDTTAAHAASAIAFTPNGSIAATDVQAAIQEVRDEAAGGATVDHDHTSAAGDGGALTNDEHDGYGQYAQIVTPGSPPAGSVRIWAAPDGHLYQKESDGTVTQIDGTPPVSSLDDIGDVDAPTPGTGDVLTFDGTNWVSDATGGETGQYVAATAPSSPATGAIWLDTATAATDMATQAELDAAVAGLQPLDADLTTIAGLTATTDSFMQAKAGAWAARTVAQVRADLAVPVLIAETTVGAGGAASVTFSGIPATYRDLLVTWSQKNDTGVTGVGLRFNGDTGANYDWQRGSFFGTTASMAEGIAQTSVRVGTSNAVAGDFAPGLTRVYEYTRTDRAKLVISEGTRFDGTTSNTIVTERSGGLWRTTNAAITSVTVLPLAGNFVQDSIIRLFGLP